MILQSDKQFEYKQNQNKQNVNQQEPYHYDKPHQTSNEYKQKKIIISDNPKIGINLRSQINSINQFYKNVILHQNINKAVINLFQKKDIVKKDQFNVDLAYEDASEFAIYYTDRIEKWLDDAVINTSALTEFEVYKQQKKQSRSAKISSIMNLIQKTSLKLQEKKMKSILKQFQQSLSSKIVVIPENKQYKKANYKFKFIKERINSFKKQIENNRYKEPQFI